MQKSFMISAGVVALIVITAITTLPMSATGQTAYYYNGYNAAPRWNSIGNQSVVQLQTLSVSASAVDDNGDVLTYSTVQMPTGSSFNQVSRVFSFTPNSNQLGSFPVTLAVTDNKSAPVMTTFYVNVTSGYGHSTYGGGAPDGYYNQAPYFSATNSHYAVYSGNAVRFTLNAVDPEGQSLRYSVNGLPAGASFDAVAHTFSWTPERNQRGSYSLLFYANDGYATSVPLSITITVDGGFTTGIPQPVYTPVPGNAAQYYPNYETSCGVTSVAPGIATAGQVYLYAVRGCENYASALSYRLTVAPTGAVIDGQTGLLSWSVPKNAVNQQYQFAVTVSNGYSVVTTQTFNVQVVGGEPTVTTVVTRPAPTVQYVTVPSTVATPVTATNYYPNPQNVYVNTGRTVTPVNYQQYLGGAYGTVALPSPAVAINVFNIAVRVSGSREMIVSWDTNKPTTGEVVFGYASQSRGADLDRTILNYDFTTGPLTTKATRHEISLGKLQTNQTYYLRVISRADNQTEISREIVFIPMTTQEGGVIVEQYDGAASAVGTIGSFLVSGGFLFFLLLIVIGLIIYLILLNRRAASGFAEPQLHMTYDDHAPVEPPHSHS